MERLDEWRKAGQISRQALEFGRDLIKPNVKLLDVAEQIEQKIEELGAEMGFPVNISLNHIAAHDTPAMNDERTFTDEVVKLDVGVHLDGCIGDTACTVDLSGKNADLVQASLKALDNAIKAVKPGVQVREIGAEIEAAISEFGVKPIYNLSGHELKEYELHAGTTIPNFDNGDITELEDGQIIAIEPFATTGSGKVIDSSNPGIFMLIEPKRVRSRVSRDFLIQALKFKGLPFCKRYIKMPLFKINFAIRDLSNVGALKEFPPLPDSGKGLVSQAEHTILVKEKPEVLTKLD
jgi:methionyl aminopeptidase